MPPKPKYSKEELISAAFEIARTEGIERVVARNVGKKLNTSTSPIFTYFDSVEELKNEVFERAKQCVRKYQEGVYDYDPAFKEFGLRWVRFALEEPKLYAMLTRAQDGMGIYTHVREEFSDLIDRMTTQISDTFSINREEAEMLFMDMLIYVNGIAAYALGNPVPIDLVELSRSLSRVCLSLLANIYLLNGKFDVNTALEMAKQTLHGTLPVKKS